MREAKADQPDNEVRLPTDASTIPSPPTLAPMGTPKSGSGGANSDDEHATEGLAKVVPLTLRPTAPATPGGGPSEILGPSFRDDPRLDRRIIEGMLGDRELFLEAMGQEGFTATAVLRRAAELGLSEAMVRQVKGVAADLAGERPGRRAAPAALGARTCLACDRIFLSSGPGNRLCMRCRGGDAGMAQL